MEAWYPTSRHTQVFAGHLDCNLSTTLSTSCVYVFSMRSLPLTGKHLDGSNDSFTDHDHFNQIESQVPA